MKKLFLPFLILQFAFTNVQASDWGQTGHRVIGLVAEQHLTQKTKAAVDNLLQGESLAYVSTYGDEIRSNKEFKHFDTWHYVNMPLDKRYGDEKPNPKGDVYHAIQHCVGVLQDNEASREDKALYLRLLVHFVGDMHQPLHVGRSEDRGGNDIKVLWFGKNSNLHRVWDSEMINGYQMSYTELANNLPIYTVEKQQTIVNTSVLDWMHESQRHAKHIYGSITQDESLGYAYQREYFPLVRHRLHKGGLRLAKLLNDIFDN